MKKSEDKKKSISRRGNCCVGVFFPPVPSRPKIGWLRLNFDNLLFLVFRPKEKFNRVTEATFTFVQNKAEEKWIVNTALYIFVYCK